MSIETFVQLLSNIMPIYEIQMGHVYCKLTNISYYYHLTFLRG